MRRKLGNLTRTQALVLIVGLVFTIAWAAPSLGASAGKVARTALARANQAFHNSNLAISSSNTAKSTASQANSTAGAANSTADSAKATASQAQTTANSALQAANAAEEVQDNFEMSFDPGDIAATDCTNFPRTRFGVLSSDEVIVTPPSSQPLGIITQAYTSTNAVTLVFCNVTSPDPINPPSGVYEFSTLR